MSQLEELYSLDSAALAERLIASVGTGTWPPVHTAVEWALERHAGQKRRDGSDFAAHPLRVALILHELASQTHADVLCASLLHDLLEDTDTTEDDIMEVFGTKVSDMVRSLTLQPIPEGKTKMQRNMAHFESLRWEGRDVQIVRSADRLDNLRTLSAIPEYSRREEYVQETEEGLVPLTLATNTALYHALVAALEELKS
jgi:GTP diphosphokinase / guanosine-3',5'-bis(diphosphate) 3'-diphosphatase